MGSNKTKCGPCTYVPGTGLGYFIYFNICDHTYLLLSFTPVHPLDFVGESRGAERVRVSGSL